MKHILNNLSDEEKNSILEQHTGGMKVISENFSKLLNSKLGDVKLLVNEMDKEKLLQSVIRGQQAKPQYGEYGGDDSDEDVSYDIKSVKCGENGMEGHVDIDEDDTIVIRYCKGDSDELEHLKRKGKKLLHSKLGDVDPFVNEQQVDTGEQNTHRYDRGEQSPGIEKFLQNPSDSIISNGLLNELRNDPYGKGKIVIIFNGEKFKEPGAFMFKIQSDFKAGKCYELTNYEYNNRFILNTQIKITANGVECKKETTPVKKTDPIKKIDPIKKTVTPKPKKFCKHKISDPFARGEFTGGSIKGFQEFCVKNNLWKKEFSDGTTAPCTSKDMDGKWGCCSQTCYNNRKKPNPLS